MRVLGLDIGIASIGWAVLEWAEGVWRIVAAGVRTFDKPETDKEKTPTNALRRGYRLQRRVVRRRRQRMNAIRRLFAEAGMLAEATSQSLRTPNLDPWALRVAGLDRALAPAEFAVALGHIAKHRGFRSTKKGENRANAPSDSGKMLKAVAATQDKLSKWRSVGEMLVSEEEFKERKRNRAGDFSRSVLRKDQEHEVRLLFEAQRRLGAEFASGELQARFTPLAFDQRSMQSSANKVGPCLFEKGERRTARRAFSFERFRLLSRLAALRVSHGRTERPLTPEEIALASRDFGVQKKLTYKWLRKTLTLEGTRFAGVAEDKEGLDFVARSGTAAEGTATLRDVVRDGAGDMAWGALLAAPEKLDRIAEILSFEETVEAIRAGLASLALEPTVLEAIVAAADHGKLDQFAKPGHISAKAARKILPHLERGLNYSDACTAACYDHARSLADEVFDVRDDSKPIYGLPALRVILREERLRALVNGPIARKAITETIKQVIAICEAHGLPDRVHVELARDVGKSAEERGEIERGIEKRNVDKDRLRDEFRTLLQREPGGEDMLRFELWKEQNGRCIYSDAEIPVTAVVATDNSVQVDHILPWSRFGDDSFVNKTLCTNTANQNKAGRTAFEWFGSNELGWEAYCARVEGLTAAKGRKKRNYLLKSTKEIEERFRARNLVDTQWITKVVAQAMKKLHDPASRFVDEFGEADMERRVFARPGALTARLRQAWGVEKLKKGEDGKRVEDDRHHALDAIVIAATSEPMLQALTRAFQQAEVQGLKQDFKRVEEPWPGFRGDAEAAMKAVFVSRAERRRARGEAHAATIKQVRERDGKTVVYERKAVEKLTEKDLANVKDAERNAALIANLQAWIEGGKQKGTRPLSPKGDEVRKVRLATKDKVAVGVREGTADRGEMARVDVFRKQNRKGKWEFYLVPIYPTDIVALEAAPMRAVTAYKPESEWVAIDDSFEFCWSVTSMALLRAVDKNGTVLFPEQSDGNIGYFRGFDRATGAFSLSSVFDPKDPKTGIGARTLAVLQKLSVDRLGRVTEVERELRTWRGKVCTSAGRPDSP